MKNLKEVVALAFYLAIIFVLVRPGSQGPKFVSAAGNSIKGLITAGTGGGSFATGK
jgi:hypothetical protein